MFELNRNILIEKYGKEKLFNLTVIDWQFNKVKRIDSNTFINLAKLEELYILNNQIEEIDVRLFESLSNLKYIDLSFNQLKRIDSNTFKNLTKLKELELHNNVIEQIDVRSFESLLSLKNLRLQNNKLKEIDRKCFEPLKSIELIFVHENVGLNALSFIKPWTEIWYYPQVQKIAKKYEFVSKWKKFLQQFPELGNNKYLLIFNHSIVK